MDVICCCVPEIEPLRAWKFYDVCANFHVYPRVLPFIEDRRGNLRGLEHLCLESYSVVFTHNYIGEYGHKHHKQVHANVLGLAQGDIYMFGYGLQEEAALKLDFSWVDKHFGISLYNHKSAVAGVPKWRELLVRWGNKFDLQAETYVKV